MKNDYGTIKERLARLEEQNKNQTSIIKETHKILVGNGKPGLVDEFNKTKGFVRGIAWVFGSISFVLSILLTIKLIV